MILVIDIGNSHIKFTTFENDAVVKRFEIETKKSLNDYSKIIKETFEENDIKAENIKGVAISSVVPEITKNIEDSLKFLNVKIIVLGNKNIKHNLDIYEDNKRNLGYDIICDLVAGKKKYEKNFIIIDIGTATTINVVDSNSKFVGGVIMPGLITIGKFLNLCSQLPNFEVKAQNKIIGDTTIEAMNGGIFWGYIGMIEKNIELIKKEKNLINPKICFTGKSFLIIKDYINLKYDFDENLTAKGLYEIWKINNK